MKNAEYIVDVVLSHVDFATRTSHDLRSYLQMIHDGQESVSPIAHSALQLAAKMADEAKFIGETIMSSSNLIARKTM
jgi:hypothetical protein